MSSRREVVPPSESTVAICTHLHTDHVGWNTRRVKRRLGADLSHARYLTAAPEWDHWSASTDRWTQIVMADSVRPLFDADLVDLVATDHAVHDTIRFATHARAYPGARFYSHPISGRGRRYYRRSGAPPVSICQTGLGPLSGDGSGTGRPYAPRFYVALCGYADPDHRDAFRRANSRSPRAGRRGISPGRENQPIQAGRRDIATDA